MSGHRQRGRRLVAVLVSMRARTGLLWFVVAGLLLFGLTGISRVQFDDELLRFFDSDLAAYHDYVNVTRDFEGDSNDVIVLIEAEDLAEPKVLTAVSDFLLNAQFLPGVRAAISPLSLRIAADGTGDALEPLIPFPPLPRAEMAARLKAARAETPALEQLMAADRTAMVAILPVQAYEPDDRLVRIELIDTLRELADTASEASGAEFRLSGYVVLRDTVARALTRDAVMLNFVGVAVGFVVAVLALRSVTLGFLTLPGPVMSVLTVAGMFGHLGVSINTVTITLPVLVVVLAASDSIHISFERGRQGARDTRRATQRAIRRVAIACIFAAVTTAIAFAALATSRSEIIAELGRMGMLITLTSVVVVLMTQTLVLTTAGHYAWFAPLFARLERNPPRGVIFGHLPRLALRHPRPVAYIAVVALAATAWLYAQAGPRYSLLDSLHADAPVLTAFRDIEAKVTPISVLQVPVESAEVEEVAKVHDAVERITGSSAVQSIGGLDPETGTGVDDLPDALAGRLVSEDGSRALVTVPFRYVNGDETLALAARVEAGLAADPALAGIGIGAVTGLPVMSSKIAGIILSEINRSLFIALVAVAVLIGLWLGNLRVALISLVPNLLPITIIGAWLTLSGRGIEFSNGLALTVAFGIAVDDTLHVLNRLRLSGGVARIERARLTQALEEVTPALVTTSMVLIFGVGGTFLAENKSVTDFGKIAMSVYFLALIADLLVLPACLAVFGPRSYLRRRKEMP